MINASGTRNPYEARLNAVMDRIEATREDPVTYDLKKLTLQFGSPAAVLDVDEGDWLHLLCGGALEDQTKIPCPSWCELPAQHHYEAEYDDGRQYRFHSIRFESPRRGSYLAITQEETRPRGDDSTFARSAPTIDLAVDASFDSATSRELTGALDTAASKLDEITGGAQ